MRSVVAAASLALALVLGLVGVASAAPASPDASARIVRIDQVGPTESDIFVDSPAMQRVVKLQVLHPPGAVRPRPTLYLLDGIDSPGPRNTWTEKTDAVRFFADKQVNVVLPVGGVGSYYTDWERPDPRLGVNQWETLLTDEVPPLVDRRFGGNGVNAVAGLSMGGDAALTLITRDPSLYRGVAAFSACGDTSSTIAKAFIRATIASRGGDATNMWGPDSDPQWVAHDALIHADNLRGKVIYQSVGNGTPGPKDAGTDPGTLAGGIALESAALRCTQQFQRRLDSLQIPATFVYRPVGTHSWPYWQDDLHASWPVLARALRLS